ncbi:MAG: PAS domain-containing sensor histidine kinase [bacterium]
MTLETIRNLILLTGWPVLVVGSFFLLYKAIKFYYDVNRVVFGRLVIIMTSGWLFTMYCLGIVSTVAMFDNVIIGVQIVLPIFIFWAASMVVITAIILSWSKEALTINEFYQDIERKYQSIFEFSPEAILLLDTTGIILASNERLHEWLNIKTDSIVGKNIVTLPFLTEESKANVMKNFAERLLGKNPPTYQVELVNQKGARMFGQVVAATVKDKNGEIIRNLTMISDVTERVKLEHLKEDLTNMIVHDLKNPLLALSGLVEFFTHEYSDNLSDKQKELLNNIYYGAKRTSNFTMDLLQINKIEDSNLNLEIGRVSIAELVTNISWLKPIAQQKCLSLSINQPPDLVLEADSKILTRVLENLLLNALKHTKQNGSITVNISEDKTSALFEITDTGEGIPEEYLKTIFNKFFKVETKSQQALYDTGLGLAFCKMAVEAHRGQISVKSKLKEGSKFYFSIPKRFSPIEQAL